MSFGHTICVVDFELGMDYTPVHAPPGPFFRNVNHGQIQHFQKAVVRGEYGFRFGHLSELSIESLDGIRGINQSADGLGELEICAQVRPVFPPGHRDPGIFLTPDFLEIVQSGQCCHFV